MQIVIKKNTSAHSEKQQNDLYTWEYFQKQYKCMLLPGAKCNLYTDADLLDFFRAFFLFAFERQRDKDKATGWLISQIAISTRVSSS